MQFVIYKFALPDSFPSSPILSRKNFKSVPAEKTKMQKSVIVHNIVSAIEEDMLKMFFENETRSGGGEVEEIDFNQSLCQALITFCDEKGILACIILAVH